jgi:hypothetical protein
MTDPQTEQVGFSGLIKENGSPALISFRLKIANKKIYGNVPYLNFPFAIYHSPFSNSSKLICPPQNGKCF